MPYITPIQHKSGAVVWYVRVTLDGRKVRRTFATEAEARVWMHDDAAVRRYAAAYDLGEWLPNRQDIAEQRLLRKVLRERPDWNPSETEWLRYVRDCLRAGTRGRL